MSILVKWFDRHQNWPCPANSALPWLGPKSGHSPSPHTDTHGEGQFVCTEIQVVYTQLNFRWRKSHLINGVDIATQVQKFLNSFWLVFDRTRKELFHRDCFRSQLLILRNRESNNPIMINQVNSPPHDRRACGLSWLNRDDDQSMSFGGGESSLGARWLSCDLRRRGYDGRMVVLACYRLSCVQLELDWDQWRVHFCLLLTSWWREGAALTWCFKHFFLRKWCSNWWNEYNLPFGVSACEFGWHGLAPLWWTRLWIVYYPSWQAKQNSLA